MTGQGPAINRYVSPSIGLPLYLDFVHPELNLSQYELGRLDFEGGTVWTWSREQIG